jgi:nicotinamide-nucleotide amidase
MNCSILCVGTELLLGQIHDTNSAYIGEKLAEAGIASFEHRRVGDNEERIIKAVTEMLQSADALIVTGGLGPTHDDITREVLAIVMGVDLEIDLDVVEAMKQRFASRNREMSENNLRQAMVPVGATLMRNPLGTAPGLVCPIEVTGKVKNVFLMPGVPHEMKFMLNEYVLPKLIADSGENRSIVTRTIKTWGLPESELAQTLDEIVQQGEVGEVKIGFLARGINGIYVKLSASADTRVNAQQKIAPVQVEVEKLIGENIYAYDDETMESTVLNLLRDKGEKLAIAESLTGGFISSRIVEIEGASDVLLGGIVSYDTRIKRDILKVDAEDIYSYQCAEQMALGVKETFGASISISTTGVAGPDPVAGSDPVAVATRYSVENLPAKLHEPGEVFIGLSSNTETISECFNLGGDRQRVREYATITALNMLRKYLLGQKSQSQSSE